MRRPLVLAGLAFALAAEPAFSSLIYVSDGRELTAVNGSVNQVTGDCFNTQLIFADPPVPYVPWDATLTGSLSSASQRSEFRPNGFTATGSSAIAPCLERVLPFETSTFQPIFNLLEPADIVLSGVQTVESTILYNLDVGPVFTPPSTGPFRFEGELQPGRYKIFITASAAIGDPWSLDFELVPEPSVLALAGIGLVGIAMSRRSHQLH